MDREASRRLRQLTATVNEEPTMTQASFAKDADLNVLVKRFGIHGVPVVPIDPSQFGDFSGAPSLREALEIVREAREQFDALPARVRYRFENQPENLLEFVRNPENREEAIYLGLIEKPRETASEAEMQPPGETPAKPGSPEGA